MAIKRYNQFIKENDEFMEYEDRLENDPLKDDMDMDDMDLDDMDVDDMDLIEDDGTNDLSDDDFSSDDVEEEEDVDIYTTKLTELANMLDAQVTDGKILYKGKTIIFPSETEMYHVDKRKFETAQQVVDYLERGHNHTQI